MAHHENGAESHGTYVPHMHHITPPSVYIKVLVGLTILMALTIGASYVVVPDIAFLPGVWINNIIAIAIAVAKALLVIWFFMGVSHSSGLTKLWVVAGFATFALMFFIMADNLTRKYEPAPGWVEGWEGSAYPRDLDPLGQDIPEDFDVNVRPRQ